MAADRLAGALRFRSDRSTETKEAATMTRKRQTLKTRVTTDRPQRRAEKKAQQRWVRVFSGILSRSGKIVPSEAAFVMVALMYPEKSPAEKFRLAQAQTVIDCVYENKLAATTHVVRR
jgi:hypothetical protein